MLIVFQAFASTGAFVTGILTILAELHREPDLKLNLKFEVEVLFKTMEVDFSEVCRLLAS